MAIQFVIGRAGTGKTHRCFRSIVDELRRCPMGPPIYWLLPRQATFSAERELTCHPELGGFCRARVLSFEELGREILEECGGPQVPLITPAGRQMMLGHLLRTHQASLKYFRSVARQPGLPARLDATFSELERSGKDATDLDVLLQHLVTTHQADNASLIDKIHDLHLIYNRYNEFLGQDRLDQHRGLIQVLGCIAGAKRLENALFYVDGFTEFTEYERRVLAQLGKACRRVEITLPMDPASPLLTDPHIIPEEQSLFHPVETTYRRLWFVLRTENTPIDQPPVLLTEVHRFQNKSLQALERLLFDKAVVYSQREQEGIELLEAPTRRDEVDAAARRIRALMVSGYRLREIAVIVRDLADYHELIEPSFREHGIPYFADRRRGMAHHPLLQMVRALLMLGQHRWSHEWMMVLLKSGLAGISERDADALENYVLRHRIRGDAWASADPWIFTTAHTLRPEDADGTVGLLEVGQLEQCRSLLIARLRPFLSATRVRTSIREIASALFETIEQFGVREQLVVWMDQARTNGQLEQLAEHQQVWKELTELFDQLVDLLGDEMVTLAGFHEIVEAGLDQFAMALTPPTVDQVLVGQADRTKTPALRAVLVLGLNERVFPKVEREDSVLSDSDRRELQTRDLHLTPATDRRLLDETQLAYHAFTSASELLYASRSTSDSAGKALGPSSYFTRLRQMFPSAPHTTLRNKPGGDPALIATPRQLLTGLMQWARRPLERRNAADSTPEPWGALYQWLATQPCGGDAIDQMRFGSWKALTYVNTAALSAAIAARLFLSPLRTDVGQLETFASCPFQHFLRYGLQLQGRQIDDGLSAMDLGHVFHNVLEQVVSDMLRSHKSWTDLGETERSALIHNAAETVARNLRGEIFLSNARNRYLLQRIEHTLQQVVANQTSVAGRGRFRPAFAQIRFGKGGQLPEFSLPTPGGNELRLRGKIDRVDVIEHGVEFAVIDYKLGQNKLQLDQVYHGIALQLLTYLLVLEANGHALAGKKLTPAAAFYVRMLRRLGDVDHPSAAIGPDDPAFHLQVKPRGLIDSRHVPDLDAALSQGASEVINATIKKDGSLGSKSRSDIADADEFAALLGHVRKRLGELADGILSGSIHIAPYLLRQTSPCPRCEYHGVCRFEPSGRGYHLLGSMDREQVLHRVVAEQEDTAAPLSAVAARGVDDGE